MNNLDKELEEFFNKETNRKCILKKQLERFHNQINYNYSFNLMLGQGSFIKIKKND